MYEQKLIRRWLIILLVGVFSFNSSILFSESNSTEVLLDKLSMSKTQKDAKELRERIWDSWLNGISIEHKKKVNDAMFKFNSGQISLAEKAFSEIIKVEPAYMEAWNKRATIRYMSGNLEGSLSDINEVLSRQPRHFGAIFGMSLIFLAQKKYEDALDNYLLLKRIDPMNLDAQKFIPILKVYVYGNST
tara:strand:- start:111 stop:677 length:567 start_codon:yes stop_codon:yes gene_type:complete